MPEETESLNANNHCLDSLQYLLNNEWGADSSKVELIEIELILRCCFIRA